MEEQDELGQILQACLDKLKNGDQTIETVLQDYPEQADELRPQLETALWLLASQHEFDPRPGFVAASHRRLLNTIRQEAVAPSKSRWAFLSELKHPQLVLRLALGLLLVLSFLLVGNRAVKAADMANPGDPAYKLKLVIENTQLTLAFSNSREAELHIQFAQTRLKEINNLALQGKYEMMPSVVQDYDEQVTKSVRLLDRMDSKDNQQARHLAGELRDVLNVQTMVLDLLLTWAPEEAQPDLQQAINVSQVGLYAAQGVLGGPLGQDKGPAQDSHTSDEDSQGNPPGKPDSTASTSEHNLSPGKTDDDNKNFSLSPTPTSTHKVLASNTPRPSRTPQPSRTPRPEKPSKDTGDQKDNNP